MKYNYKDSKIINFDEPFVMEKSFIVLFPYGWKGIADNRRKTKVYNAEFVQHCFKYYTS